MEFTIRIPEWFLYAISAYMVIKFIIIVKQSYKVWKVIRKNKKELDGQKKTK